jgi:ribulose 1,5-bisphosphate carboxylase large subunit-like protein
MIDPYLFQPSVDKENHIIATYFLESKSFLASAKAIAIGQSIGNPDIRTKRESPNLLRDHLAKILDHKSNLSSKDRGYVKIAFPLVNFNPEEDGITHLLCNLMGGQMDIDIINKCQLVGLELPEGYTKVFKGPKFGLEEIKKRAKAENRPLLGGIIKPKTGITPKELKDMCLELVQGGVDFIKEDEILGNPKFCNFKERVELVSNAINDGADDQGREIFYAPCINGDYPYFLDNARYASEVGAKAVHLNIWAGFSAYRALRDANLKTAIHFQKSGDKVITGINNYYNINWSIVCKIARLLGADFIHAGMWGGYLSDSKEDLTKVMIALKNKNGFKQTIPALSCGSHPGLVGTTMKNFGIDLMMTVGGAIQAHPLGASAGAKAMRQAFEVEMRSIHPFDVMGQNLELKEAIKKWGYTE